MGLSEQEQRLSSLSTATQPPTQAEEASPVLRLRIPDQRELTQVLMVAGAGTRPTLEHLVAGVPSQGLGGCGAAEASVYREGKVTLVCGEKKRQYR